MSNVRSRLMRRHTRCAGQSLSSFSAILERYERQQEALQAYAVSCASVAEREAFPGPPVRWRSAHRQCCGSQFSRHGRPVQPSVGASRLHGATRQSLWSVSAHGHMRVAELARPRTAKQTRAMECPSFLVAVKLQQFAPVVSGVAAFKACLPAPNHSIERTCLKPLRAFSPTAHVER